MTEQELNSVRELKKRIAILEKKLNGLRMLAQHLTPVLDGLPHATSSASKVENVAIKILDAERELETLRAELSQVKDWLTQKILDVTDEPALQTLLILHYVKCFSFRETARLMHYTLRQVFRKHSNFFAKMSPPCNTLQHLATP